MQYHNDIHAADILQMSYLILTHGNVIQFAGIGQLDLLSIVIAAVGHDIDHDGFNNAYHVNSISERAICYSDQSVQENHHAATTFKIL